ncbi:MAG: [FeFe] hydrogenase H-cluster maturation GTPase HydF [Sedimentisphaerales bacterium]|nr:[FeFe] hydrogenase H-cluster maturation GTPase HydF [Sedimentisphaerales bacterium]
MLKTPKSLRLHIGVFGRRNVGKSSILNALVRQNVSIVSDVAGTTTDPVEKVMELKPIGPVVFIDTAGIDDIGALGCERVRKTMGVIDRTELAVLVTDEWLDYENRLLVEFKERNIAVVVAANKTDLRQTAELEERVSEVTDSVVSTNALEYIGIDALREAIIAATPAEFLENNYIIANLIEQGSMTIFVTPIDIEAPKGRLKMLQVHCLREILDKNANAIVCKETELEDVLNKLKQSPELVVCDSQVLHKVTCIVPDDVIVTTFSILMARFKSNFEVMSRGTKAIDSLQENDKVLILEACTHHPIGDDIGRVQIPELLKQYVGGELNIDVVAGRDLPDDISRYKVIIHCGGCVFNRKEMLSRVEKAKQAGVPITNYGMAISYLHGLFHRAMEPFAVSESVLK